MDKTTYDYLSPVSALLTLGDPREARDRVDYHEIGLTEEHIPDLVRMIHDDALHLADSESVKYGRRSTPGGRWALCGPSRR